MLARADRVAIEGKEITGRDLMVAQWLRTVNEEPHPVDAAVYAAALEITLVVTVVAGVAVMENYAIGVATIPGLQLFNAWPPALIAIEAMDPLPLLVLAVSPIIEISERVRIRARNVDGLYEPPLE